MLRQVLDPGAAVHEDLTAAVRPQLADQKLDERRLAAPVAAQERDAGLGGHLRGKDEEDTCQTRTDTGARAASLKQA